MLYQFQCPNRMTDIQAAVGIEQLKKLDFIVSERRKIAKIYIDALKNLDCIQLPLESEQVKSNYQSFSIILKDNCPISRDNLMQKMLDAGIATRRGIMTSHRETAYKDWKDPLPRSEQLADNSILIPLYVPMTSDEVKKVISTLREFLQN